MKHNAMTGSADWIFQETIDAMQQAEELGGCRGVIYIELMEAISRTALQRAKTYAGEIHRATQIACSKLARDTAKDTVVGFDADQLTPIAQQFGISVAEVQQINAYCESRR